MKKSFPKPKVSGSLHGSGVGKNIYLGAEGSAKVGRVNVSGNAGVSPFNKSSVDYSVGVSSPVSKNISVNANVSKGGNYNLGFSAAFPIGRKKK